MIEENQDPFYVVPYEFRELMKCGQTERQTYTMLTVLSHWQANLYRFKVPFVRYVSHWLLANRDRTIFDCSVLENMIELPTEPPHIKPHCRYWNRSSVASFYGGEFRKMVTAPSSS
jgi:hypothetical protein